jgi:hypothetical protein
MLVSQVHPDVWPQEHEGRAAPGVEKPVPAEEEEARPGKAMEVVVMDDVGDSPQPRPLMVRFRVHGLMFPGYGSDD